MQIGLVIYGSLDTLSGGYLYDRWLVRALHAAGHQVTLYQMPWRSYGHHLTDNLNPQWRRRLLSAPVDLWLQDELNHPSLCWINRQLRRRHGASTGDKRPALHCALGVAGRHVHHKHAYP